MSNLARLNPKHISKFPISDVAKEESSRHSVQNNKNVSLRVALREVDKRTAWVSY